MPARQIPSEDCFVINVDPAAARAVCEELAGLGAVEALEGSDLVLLELGRPAADLRAAWQRIVEGSRAAEWVAPLLLDESGEPHYPTGEVSVRFPEPRSDDELARFGATHGLRLRHRNEFVPEQAVFEPVDPRRTFLPDLVRSLGDEAGVAAVWANTTSRYRRG